MSKERLEELLYNPAIQHKEILWGINYAKELEERVQDQQATIDSLSMAHDAIHRELPKDKHTLIKNLIALNAELNFTEEALEGLDKAYEREKEQNKRYKELIDTIIYRLITRDAYDKKTVIDAIQLDVYKFMEGEE